MAKPLVRECSWYLDYANNKLGVAPLNLRMPQKKTTKAGKKSQHGGSGSCCGENHSLNTGMAHFRHVRDFVPEWKTSNSSLKTWDGAHR